MIDKGEKVFGGMTTSEHGPQVRTIVVAKSQKEAAAMLRCSLHEFRHYWAETGSAVELAVAARTNGKIFKATTSMGCDFRAVKL